MRRRKHVTLGHKLTLRQFNACNRVLLSNGVAAVAKEGRTLPNVAALLRRAQPLTVTKLGMLRELEAALDGTADHVR